MKQIRIEWREYEDNGKPVGWIGHTTMTVDDLITVDEPNRRLAAAGFGEKVRLVDLGAIEPASGRDLEGAINACIAAHFDGWPEANLGAIEERERERREAMNARKLDRLERDLGRLVDVVQTLAVAIADRDAPRAPTTSEAIEAARTPIKARRADGSEVVIGHAEPVAEQASVPVTLRPNMRLSYATWTSMSVSEREAALAGFNLTVEDAAGGEVHAAQPSSAPSREPEVSLAIDETVVPPRMLKPDGTPAIPVLGKDGSIRGERAGTGPVANVESKGWGIAGPAAKAEIERIGPDGSISKEKLPTVGDTLRAPRSNW